jgi:hypothetical protein
MKHKQWWVLTALGLIQACGTDSQSDDTTSMDAAVDSAVQVDSAIEAQSGAPLGGACVSDADCMSGLTCSNEANLVDFDSPYFPAHGLCTLECASSADCESVGGGACTSRTGSPRYCVPTCMTRGTPTGPLEPGKCLGRPDLACQSGSNQCVPNCNDDLDCPEGRTCDPLMGRCSKGTHPALIDMIGQTEGCKGLVLTDSTDAGTRVVCSAFCTVGVARTCGWDGVTMPQPTLCRGIAVGDQGTCVRLCDCDSDCATPLSCLPLTRTSQLGTGRAGYCFYNNGTSTLTCGADSGTGADATTPGDAATPADAAPPMEATIVEDAAGLADSGTD